MDHSTEELVQQAVLDFLAWLQGEEDVTLCTFTEDEIFYPIPEKGQELLRKFLAFLREHRAISIDLEADLVGLARKVAETAKEVDRDED